MSALFLFFVSVVFISSCKIENDSELYDAEIRIDSLNQDTVHFGLNLIPGNLHVYYSVVNNDFADIYSYSFYVTATNTDSAVYVFKERSDNVVLGKTTYPGEVVMGIGKFNLLNVSISGVTFE